MTCYHPIHAWQKHSDGSLTWRETKASAKKIQLPCGRCIGCRKVKVREWATRCVHEASLHKKSCFVTLTYNDEHYTPALEKEHLQMFLKRLRHRKGKLRYFAAGEYGKKEQRPHWHILIFGQHFTDLKRCKGSEGHELYQSNELDTIWGKGYTSVGEINYTTAGYVAKYAIKQTKGNTEKTKKIEKQRYERLDPTTGEIIQVPKERGYMSLKPGLGEAWIQKHWRDVYVTRDGIVQTGGRLIPAPTFYDRQLKKIAPGLLIDKKDLRRNQASNMKHDNTPARLAVKETCAIAQIKHTEHLKL